MRILVRILLITGFILVLVRVFVLEPYAIPTGSMRPVILEGDVILVSKLPYRIRSLRYLPFTQTPLPYLELPGLGHLERGDVVVFDYPFPSEINPGEGTQYVKRAMATAGDTVQLVEGRIRVNGVEVPSRWGIEEDGRNRRAPVIPEQASRLFRDGDPVITPFKGYEIQIDSVIAERWRFVMEGEGYSVGFRNHIVFIGGLPATRYTFKRDYFLALGDNSLISKDSRYFGFVPYDNLIGQAWMIYWSRDPDDGVRWGRICNLIR
ncbi:MAG: signal peptidase I [Candidatus Kapaibacterium sp.]